jgi:hypothetical protein
MLEHWIESVFLKRFCLSFAAAAAAYIGAHSLPGISHLAVAGINVTVSVDPAKLADWMGVTAIAVTQGLHEYVAAKYPELGKYL